MSGQKSITASDFGRVAVLMGGTTAEREVSLKSGAAVLDALRSRGVDAHGVDVGADILEQLQRDSYDRAFVILHGGIGENGVLQGMLELLGLPYTGSGVLASAVGMDKWRCKMLWQGAGLPVPASRLLQADSDWNAVTEELGLPLFVKPANEGSSVGVARVDAVEALEGAYREAVRYDSQVLAESYMGGGEYTVAVLNGEALPAVKIEPARGFYDYQAKYISDDTVYRCPCGLSEEAEREMRELALQAFAVLGCSGWGRIDILLDGAQRPHLLEANTLPGMTDHSLVPKAAAVAGIAFDELVWRILETTLEVTRG